MGESPPAGDRVKVVRVAAGGPAREEWVRALGPPEPAGGRLLKADGPAGVWWATLVGRPVVLKVWVWRPLLQRLKALGGVSRANRQWKGAERLRAAGVPTAAPLALARRRSGPVVYEWLVLEHIAGPTLIDLLDQSGMTVGAEQRLAAAVGEQVGAIVSAGLYNRDHKPSNLLVSDGGRVTVLDTVAIRRCARGSVRRAALMLASLYIEPTGLGCVPRRTLRARAVRSAGSAILARAGGDRTRPAMRTLTRLLWEAAADIAAAHGDPRSAVDPRRADRA